MSSGLSPELVVQLIDSGMTQTEIGTDFGVSRQYVSKLARDGGYRNPFRTMSENLPWKIHADFTDNTLYKNVRRHGILTSTGELKKSDRLQLRSMYRKLQGLNMVVDYDLKHPAIPGFTNTPGFAYLPRTDQDEDFILKIRPGVRITPTGDRIWRMPAVLP